MNTQPLEPALTQAAHEHMTVAPSELAMLTDVIRTVARNHRLRPEDADDFAQSVHVRLLGRNYDVFERFSGRSSLRTYLTVVVVRLLLDWRDAHLGRWRPSTEASRLGVLAVELERLMSRDGFPADQAIRLVSARNGTPIKAIEHLRHRLPARSPRRVEHEGLLDDVGGAAFEDPVQEAEERAWERRVRMALREALERLSKEDRLILRCRFSPGLTVRSASRALAEEPKRIYRRLQRILLRLRADLVAQGICELPRKL